jgi:aconitate hydratase
MATHRLPVGTGDTPGGPPPLTARDTTQDGEEHLRHRLSDRRRRAVLTGGAVLALARSA